MVLFLLVNVYGVSIVSGTMVSALMNAFRDPSETVAVIAAELPGYSGFFCSYILVKATVSLTIELLRGLTLFHMATRWLFQVKDATSRERKEVIIGIRRFDNPGWLPFGKRTYISAFVFYVETSVLAYPLKLTRTRMHLVRNFLCHNQDIGHFLLVLTMLLSFGPIAPLILLPGIMYFSYSQVVYRYSLSFVYEARFESGGSYWPKSRRWLLRVLHVSQVFLCCVFSFRAYYYGVCVCFLLFVTTDRFSAYVEGKEEEELRHTPLEAAVQMSRVSEGSTSPIFFGQSQPKKTYKQPSLETPAFRQLRSASDQPATPSSWSSDPLHGGYGIGGTGGWNPLRRLYCMSKKATSENDRGGSAVDSSKPTAAEGSSAVAVEREL